MRSYDIKILSIKYIHKWIHTTKNTHSHIHTYIHIYIHTYIQKGWSVPAMVRPLEGSEGQCADHALVDVVVDDPAHPFEHRSILPTTQLAEGYQQRLMYVCMYVCMYVRKYESMYVCMHFCTVD